MLQEKYLCISYFDEYLGPNILFCTPPKPNDNDFPDLTRILEFQENEGSFVFAFRRYQSINHIFYIESPIARGGKELLMISFLLRTSFFKNELGEVFNYLNSKSEILEKFAYELKELNGFNKILHKHKKDPEEFDLVEYAKESKIELLILFKKYFSELAGDPEINIITKDARIKRKVFIIGPASSGKKIFLRNIEALQFYRQTEFSISTRVFGIFIENLKIPPKPIDIQAQIKSKSIDAYIYIFRNINEAVINQVKIEINNIISLCKENNSPITILIIENNDGTTESLKSSEFYKNFNLTELKKEKFNLKFYSINILKEDDKILQALKWLIYKII